MNMIQSLECIKEKIQWIKSLLEHYEAIMKRTSDYSFRALQIPRKTTWKDNYIALLVENTEKNRILSEELINIISMTVWSDSKELSDDIDTELNHLIKEREEMHAVSKLNFDDLHEKRESYIDAMKNNTYDPWFAMENFKQSYNNYIRKKQILMEEFNFKLLSKEGILKEIEQRYDEIARNLFRILKNHTKALSMIYDFDFNTNNYDFQDEVYYDMPNENDKVDIRQVKNFEGTSDYCFDDFIEQIHYDISKNEGDLKIKKPKILKYGIYKYKKINKTEWKLLFLVLSESKHLHGFDIAKIMGNNPNLKAKYSLIYQRLLENPQKKIFFFFDGIRKDGLNFKEERELVEFSNSVIEEANFINSLIKGFSFNLNLKSVKLIKEKYEILISSKNTNSFTNFFGSSSYKIKSFIMKDLFDLYFIVQKELPTVHRIESVENESSKTDSNDQIEQDSAVEEIEDEKEKVVWANLQEENPWENI